jgi:hypothetical protein
MSKPIIPTDATAAAGASGRASERAGDAQASERARAAGPGDDLYLNA